MNSLPQEIIDDIIDNLPRSTLRSSSLVAKRWRRRSQQHVLFSVMFFSESDVNSWEIDTQEDPGRIPSYVQAAKFNRIIRWNDPLLFGRVLQNFSSLKTLWTYETELPGEVLEYITRGELGKNLTALDLWSPRCSLSIAISTILAFPNLQHLVIDTLTTTSSEAPQTYSILPRKRPLDLLRVVGRADGVAQTLANLQFASRRLILGAQTWNVHELLILSSMTVIELALLDDPNPPTPHLVDLPPFPALTSLKIYIYGRAPSPHLINTLSSISSAPALASIFLECWWWFLSGSEPPNTWDSLDTWLVQMAGNSTVEDGLTFTLTRWQEVRVLRALFPKFKEVGKIKTDPEGLDI